MVQPQSHIPDSQCILLELPFGEVVTFSAPAPYKLPDEPNEDSIAVIPIDDNQAILVVADGVGGGPAGEEASRTIIECLKSLCLSEPHHGSVEGFVIAGIEEAQQKIRSRGDGAASTLAIAHVSETGIRPIHIGDSAVVVAGQKGKLKLATIPHSPVGYALESGLMTEKEAFSHEDRHLVSNVVGAEDMFIAMGAQVEMAPRDTVVVASDGLFDNVLVGEVIDVVRRGPLLTCADHLARLALDRMASGPAGKPDDVSFLLYRRRRSD